MKSSYADQRLNLKGRSQGWFPALSEVGWDRFLGFGAALIGMVALALSLAAPAAAQNAQVAQNAQSEEVSPLQGIIAKHLEARGGRTAIAAVKGLEVSAKLEVEGGFEIDLVQVKQRPNLMKVTSQVMGQELIEAHDGTYAWTVNPMTGVVKPTALEGPKAAQVLRESLFDSPLVGSRAQGIRVEYLGEEEIEGKVCYALKADYRDGSSIKIYLGKDDSLEHVVVTNAVDESGQAIATTIVISDHRSVEGPAGPFLVSHQQVIRTAEGSVTMTVEQVRVDPDIPEGFFLMPGQSAQEGIDLDTVLRRHRSARSLDGDSTVKALVATGKVVFQGFELPVTLLFERPRSARVSIDMQGMEMILAYDGATAWTVSPMQGITEPEAFGPEAEDAVTLFSDFLWGILGDTDGADVEFKGISRVERDQTYEMGLTLADGKTRQVFLGGEDFLERRITFETEFLGAQQTIRADLEDYRSVGGDGSGTVVFPHRIQLSGDTVQILMTLEGAEVNPSIPEGTFSMPPKAEE